MQERYIGAIAISTVTLDEPGQAQPSMHIYTKHQVPWLKLADGVPCHDEFPS